MDSYPIYLPIWQKPPAVLQAYLSLNELVEKTSLSPAHQQVALLAASLENECDFCSVAHRAIGKLKGVDETVLNAMHESKPVNDQQSAALAAFTQAVVKQRGNVDDKTIDAFIAAGFTKQNIFEVILIVSIKTLSNYTNHLTHPEPNAELLGML